MTPQEKAKELVDKFYFDLPQWVNTEDAKICALIAVDEILKILEDDENIYVLGDSSYINFWNNVKQEIEKL